MVAENTNSTKTLSLAVLYPQEMNMYGDRGNTLALLHRARQHGYKLVTRQVSLGDELGQADIFLGGGGQDSGQIAVAKDLLRHRQQLHEMVAAGVPMLMICGMYQLFGKYFKPVDASAETLQGIGVFDAYTVGGPKRAIGNIVLQSEKFGEILGYENHSGLTYLGAQTKPFGRVISGAGNNFEDKHEGAIKNNVIGTYLHGSLLPKNPNVTDFLLRTAAERKYGYFESVNIDDSVAEAARAQSKARPR